MKRIVIRASKRDLFKRFPNKKFPTNRLMYQLYKEYFDQVWPSSAKNFRETLHSRAKPTKKSVKKVGMKTPTSVKVVFSDETMLELNSKGKVFVRRLSTTRLDSRFFEKLFSFSTIVDGLRCIRSNGDTLLIPIKKQGGFR